MSLDRCFASVLKYEGGYINHPNDPGGETKYGVSKRQYPYLDIKNLTESHAKEIFKADYWAKIKGDKLPFEVALVMSHIAFMSGPSKAVRILQQSLCLSSVDGILGPQTLSEVKLYLDDRTPAQLARVMLNDYEDYLEGLAENNSRYASFITGWRNRLEGIAREVDAG